MIKKFTHYSNRNKLNLLKKNRIQNTLDPNIELKPFHMLQKISNKFQPNALNTLYVNSYSKPRKYFLSKSTDFLNNQLIHFFHNFYIMISKPIIFNTPTKLIIFLNYYVPKRATKLENRHI